MSVRLHIERLVVEGLPAGAVDEQGLRTEIQNEVTRMVRSGSLRATQSHSRDMRSVAATPVNFASQAGSSEFSQQIAGALGGVLGAGGAR